MRKPINTNKMHLYMLGYEMVYENGKEVDYEFYLYKHQGEVKITPERALEWLDAGIDTFNDTRAEIRKMIQEKITKKNKEVSK